MLPVFTVKLFQKNFLNFLLHIKKDLEDFIGIYHFREMYLQYKQDSRFILHVFFTIILVLKNPSFRLCFFCCSSPKTFSCYVYQNKTHYILN